jgi:toxin ParE1/3/4
VNKCIYSNQAVADLTEIWNYTIETWSEEQADFYYEQLTAFCKKLAERPEIGRKYPVIGLEVRGIIFGRHLVVYKIIEPDAVEIIRILHEKMDVGSQLG